MILGRDKHEAAAGFDELDRALLALRPEPPVYLNAHAFPTRLPVGSVVYNLENVGIQVSTNAFAGLEIWDFSRRNVRAWEAAGRQVTHVPVGYHPSMTCFEMRPWAERDIDVVFVGHPNERRLRVIQELKRAGFGVEHLTGRAFGRARDEILARSKLALNMRFYKEGVFPILRSAHCVANGLLTVNEESPETPDWLSVVEPYTRLAQRAQELLEDTGTTIRMLAAYDLGRFRLSPLVLPRPAPRFVGDRDSQAPSR
jgi:hypothetical protein